AKNSTKNRGRQLCRQGQFMRSMRGLVRTRTMASLLEGHLAVVTGSGSGIGHAIALGYAREGAQIVALDIDGNSAAEINRAGGKGHSLTLDVRERDRCRQVAEEIENKIGRGSTLVNNAGINRRNAFTAHGGAVIATGKISWRLSM